MELNKILDCFSKAIPSKLKFISAKHKEKSGFGAIKTFKVAIYIMVNDTIIHSIDNQETDKITEDREQEVYLSLQEKTLTEFIEWYFKNIKSLKDRYGN